MLESGGVNEMEITAMGFEVFDRKSVPRIKEATITVQRRGTLSLSGQAVDLLIEGEEKPDQIPIELLYDRDRRVIGVRKAPKKMNAHLLRRQGSSSIYLIAGSLFCAHYGIDTSVARRYRAKRHGDIVGICLDEPHIEVGRHRPKSRSGDESSDKESTEEIGGSTPGDPVRKSSDTDPWRS